MIGEPTNCPSCGSTDIRWYIDTYYCGHCDFQIETEVKDPFLKSTQLKDKKL